MKLVVVLALSALLMTGVSVTADDETTTAEAGGFYVTDWGGPFPGVRAETNGCEGMQAHAGDDGCEEADEIII